MSNLFKKAAVWTDIHLGKKSNSIAHLDDCFGFTKWAIEKAKEEGCETCIFLGDFFDSRSSLNIRTLNYGIRALEMMGKEFEQCYIVTGNHDLYYRDSRDLISTEFADRFPGVEIIRDMTQLDDVAFVPWMVGDDHLKLKKIKTKYAFGHLELPKFLMNAQIQMPETGPVKDKDFHGIERVFTGHFHKRQERGNIFYIGNTFPMNFSDAWDDERGIMILEWDGDPEYHSWPGAPKYRTLKLSDLVTNPELYLGPNTYARVQVDVVVSYEEANYIRESLIDEFKLREINLIPEKNRNDLDQEVDESIEFQSVDTIVTQQLAKIESEFYQPQLLLDIYNTLK